MKLGASGYKINNEVSLSQYLNKALCLPLILFCLIAHQTMKTTDTFINAFSNMIFYDINVNVRLLAQEMGKQKMVVKSSKCQWLFEVIVVFS